MPLGKEMMLPESWKYKWRKVDNLGSQCNLNLAYKTYALNCTHCSVGWVGKWGMSSRQGHARTERGVAHLPIPPPLPLHLPYSHRSQLQCGRLTRSASVTEWGFSEETSGNCNVCAGGRCPLNFLLPKTGDFFSMSVPKKEVTLPLGSSEHLCHHTDNTTHYTALLPTALRVLGVQLCTKCKFIFKALEIS